MPVRPPLLGRFEKARNEQFSGVAGQFHLYYLRSPRATYLAMCIGPARAVRKTRETRARPVAYLCNDALFLPAREPLCFFGGSRSVRLCVIEPIVSSGDEGSSSSDAVSDWTPGSCPPSAIEPAYIVSRCSV